MEAVVCIIVFFVFAAVIMAVPITMVVLVVVLASKQRGRRDDALRQVAAARGGEVRPGNWMTPPEAWIPHRGLCAHIRLYTVGGKHKKYYTELGLPWPDPRFRCEVFPDGIFQRLRLLLGMVDLEIGSPAFDRDFIVHASDHGRICEILTDGVQVAIGRLRELGNSDVCLSIMGGWLRLRVGGWLNDRERLERFVDMCLDLYDRARREKVEGIEFVFHDAAKSQPADVICQICGDAITADTVVCRDCRTPHHADCWEYYGSCSTYGCGAQSYARA